MIRPTEERDLDAVCRIVNDNWKSVYAGHVGASLLDENGCAERARRLKSDFAAHKLSEFLWEENGEIAAMMSFGDSGGNDAADALEIWRLYAAERFQGMGIGRKLLAFAEQQAEFQGRDRIVIWAFQENIRAVAFYQKHGYCIDKEKYLGEPYCAAGVRLTKTLHPPAEQQI